MKKVTPYGSKTAAIASLDNGGRFYNFFTDANDGEITPAELGKVAGVFSNRQNMMLYLEMAMCELGGDVEDDVVAMFDESLKQSYYAYRPSHYAPVAAARTGRPSQSAIVTGIPRFVESCSDFNGFIMVPISTGKSMTMIMVPLIDRYDVYEVRAEDADECFLIAHARGIAKLPAVETRFGGIIKELQPKKGEPQKHKVFLEVLYYTDSPRPLPS